ncbi:MAG: alpha/beta hydrolase [Bacteroidota bacterium]
MRKELQLFIFFFGIVGGLYSCTSEENVAPTDENGTPLAELIFTNISYGPDEQQIFDIYLPEGRSSEKTKVILLVHGGAWTGGDKQNLDGLVQTLRQQFPEHAIVNINYVLASMEAPVVPAFPNQFLDIGAAINKLTREKDNYQILPEFGLIGTSAGAHLSLMYDFVYDTTDQVKFVADVVGPTDFTDPFYANDPDFETGLALLVDESQYPDGTDYARATSPLYQVNTMSSPAVLFYGNQDPLVPLTNGSNLSDALTAAKVPHSFTTYNGGHADDWSNDDKRNMQSQLEEYVESYLAIE